MYLIGGPLKDVFFLNGDNNDLESQEILYLQ